MQADCICDADNRRSAAQAPQGGTEEERYCVLRISGRERVQAIFEVRPKTFSASLPFSFCFASDRFGLGSSFFRGDFPSFYFDALPFS